MFTVFRFGPLFFIFILFYIFALRTGVAKSSVYCFYDPDYRALALGKLTALLEIKFTRTVRATYVPILLYHMPGVRIVGVLRHSVCRDMSFNALFRFVHRIISLLVCGWRHLRVFRHPSLFLEGGRPWSPAR